jgi:hypothetical protein
MEHETKAWSRSGSDDANPVSVTPFNTYNEKRNETTAHGGDVENGHLTELEVDLGRVLGEGEEVDGDWDADTSPFAAVRAVVPETDDPDMPVNTFRAWFLGIVSHWPAQERDLGPCLL